MRERPVPVLQRRIFSASILLSLVAVVAIGGFLTRSFNRNFIELTEGSLKSQAVLSAHAVASLLSDGRKTEVAAEVSKLKAKLSAYVTVIDSEGLVLGDSFKPEGKATDYLSRSEFLEALSGGTGTSKRYSDEYESTMLYVAVPLISNGRIVGAVRAASSLQDLREVTRRIYLTLGSVLLAVLAVISGLGYVLSGRITRPITALSNAALRFADGDYSIQVRVEGDDEMSALAKSFNYMGRMVSTSIEQLQQEKRRIEAILSNLAEGVLVTDRHGVITMANKAAERMFGFIGSEVMGKPVITALINHEVDHGVLTTLTLNQPTESEIVTSRPLELVLRVYSVPLAGYEGGMSGSLVVFQDISKLKRLEQVRQDFVSNVSHELRTPIASIKAMAETLLAGALEDEDIARRFLSSIDSEADRLTRLVEDLLQLGRIESGNARMFVEEFQLLGLIDEVALQLDSKAEMMGVQMVKRCQPQLRLIADRDRIHQVLMNLVDNAVTYSGKGSTVRIEAWVDTKDHIVIIVEDNGVGIPTDHLERIFERFYRVDRARSRQVGGTGLGLSIVKHIVDAHDGIITVQSAEGRGTRFEVCMPVKATGRSEKH